MNEKKGKSVEDQIREAELERIRAETADFERRGKQIRVMGVPFVQIVFGGVVVGFIFLNYLLPIISLDSQLAVTESKLAGKISELQGIEYDLRSSKLDTANFGLQLRQAKLDSKNKVLSKKARDLLDDAKKSRNEVALLKLERIQIQGEISEKSDSLIIVQQRIVALQNDFKLEVIDLLLDQLEISQLNKRLSSIYAAQIGEGKLDTSIVKDLAISNAKAFKLFKKVVEDNLATRTEMNNAMVSNFTEPFLAIEGLLKAKKKQLLSNK